MSLAVVYSRANIGIEAPLITVEVHLSQGLPGFTLVGLPEAVVRESRERVRSAILHSGLEFPQRRITINLAPADLPKTGGRFDLAIALGILAASGQLRDVELSRYEFMGELSLAGDVRFVLGLLPGLIAGSRKGRTCIVPQANAAEAALPEQPGILLCSHLLQVLAYFRGERALDSPAAAVAAEDGTAPGCDFAEVAGQQGAKRALLLAAAGGHNLLMRGPPGTGKTMLASRLIGILPPLDVDQAMELAALRSISGSEQDYSARFQPPFRAPHHTSSAIALTGGGTTLHAGEISLAHHGVLFLDELPEFSMRALEVLREPLEAGHVQISRANYQVRLPARFQLIAAMNPCPCGYAGDPERDCRCSPDRVRRYQQRISGPLLDRIDIQIEVPRLNGAERRALLEAGSVQTGQTGLTADTERRGERAMPGQSGVRGQREQREQRRQTAQGSESGDNGGSGKTQQQAALCSQQLRQQVIACRAVQFRRQGCINARLEHQALQQHCALSAQDSTVLETAISRLKLSVRACFRVLKIARTIADLEGKPEIGTAHLMEALNYRRLESG